MVKFWVTMYNEGKNDEFSLRESFQLYLTGRDLAQEVDETQLLGIDELQLYADAVIPFEQDLTLEFTLGMIQLRMMQEEGISPAILLAEIVDIAQYALQYFHDERSLTEFMSLLEQFFE